MALGCVLGFVFGGCFANRSWEQVQRDHKKAEAAGTRVPVKANGLPVKPPKPTSIVRFFPSLLLPLLPGTSFWHAVS